MSGRMMKDGGTTRNEERGADKTRGNVDQSSVGTAYGNGYLGSGYLARHGLLVRKCTHSAIIIPIMRT